MTIKLLCICYNSKSCIYNTLKTWEPYVDEFCILINGGYDNDYSQVGYTIEEINKLNKKRVIIVEEFKDFSSCRNSLINKCYQKGDTIIFIDDSYELVIFKPVKKIFPNQAIKVLHNNNQYFSTRIFNYRPEYIGKIHEYVDKDKSFISGIVVRDRVYKEHFERTLSRQNVQIELLKEDISPRGLYYTACAYVNLYLNGDKTEEETITAIKNRLAVEDTHTDEYQRCYLFLSVFL